MRREKSLVGNANLLVSPVLILSLIFWVPSVNAKSEVGGKMVMGWLETVFLRPLNLHATAKLDTGAKTSSVHASKIEHFTRDGKAWVRFEFVASKGADAIKIERPLVRKAVTKERLSRSSTRAAHSARAQACQVETARDRPRAPRAFSRALRL